MVLPRAHWLVRQAVVAESYDWGMAVWRRCENCHEPLKATVRSDARFCSSACRAAHSRWLRHYDEAVEIGLAFIWGVPTEQVVSCPVCGRRFALGHGHRRDARYDRSACRQAAYRARCARGATRSRNG